MGKIGFSLSEYSIIKEAGINSHVWQILLRPPIVTSTNLVHYQSNDSDGKGKALRICHVPLRLIYILNHNDCLPYKFFPIIKAFRVHIIKFTQNVKAHWIQPTVIRLNMSWDKKMTTTTFSAWYSPERSRVLDKPALHKK